MKKFVIIDGNAIVHRSYHAVPKTLTSPTGELTNATYGFVSILFGILEYENPDYLAVAFDMKGPTFRHADFAAYKGTRKKTDDALIAQFPRVREVLEKIGVPIFSKEGLEADDFLGIVSEELVKEPDVRLIIVTGDQDALQLVDDKVEVVAPISGYTKVKRYDRDAVMEKLGVWPEQIPDYKGLRGDSSDNIPGVHGIGEKTAATLLAKFGSVEKIYENIDSVEPERIRELLIKNKDVALLSKKVATILRRDGDFRIDLNKCGVGSFHIENARPLFQELAFNSLMRRAESMGKKWAGRTVAEKQATLF